MSKDPDYRILNNEFKNLTKVVDSYKGTVKNLEMNLPDLIKASFEPALEIQKKDIKIIILETLRDQVPSKEEHNELKEDYKKTRKTMWAAIVAATAALGETVIKNLPFVN